MTTGDCFAVETAVVELEVLTEVCQMGSANLQSIELVEEAAEYLQKRPSEKRMGWMR